MCVLVPAFHSSCKSALTLDSKLGFKLNQMHFSLVCSLCSLFSGIPSLLQPEDMVKADKLDENAVMNYVCMLVSAAEGAMKLVSREG